MNPELFSAEANSAVRKYRSLQYALLGMLDGHVSTASAMNVGSRGRFSLKVINVIETHYQEMVGVISDLTEEMRKLAIANVEKEAGVQTISVFEGLMAEEVEDFLFNEKRDLAEFYHAQLERDRRSVLRYAREFALRVLSVMNSSRMSQGSAQVAVRLTSQRPDMVFLDRSGKRWGAETFVYRLFRSYAMKIYNEVYLYSLAMIGKNSAYVRHPDPKHKYNGIEFAIADPTLGLPLYEDIKDDIFHPNSSCYVVAG